MFKVIVVYSDYYFFYVFPGLPVSGFQATLAKYVSMGRMLTASLMPSTESKAGLFPNGWRSGQQSCPCSLFSHSIALIHLRFALFPIDL